VTDNIKEGLKLYKEKHYDQALYYFDEENPLEHPINAYYMGLSHLCLEHWDETLELLDVVLLKDEDLLRILHCQILKGFVLIQQENWSGAETWLRQVVLEGTDSSQVQSLLGYALFRQGRRVEGLKHLNQALKMDPTNMNVMNSLGYLLAEEGVHLSKALGLVRKAHFSDPENPAYLDSLGWVLYKMNQPVQAQTYLEKALKKKSHPQIQIHLEELHRNLGKSGLIR